MQFTGTLWDSTRQSGGWFPKVFFALFEKLRVAPMKKWVLVLLVVVLYALHQDVWFWRTAQPIAFGFLPIGLTYHVCYTLAVCLVMWLLVQWAWPAQLEAVETSTAEESFMSLGDARKE